MVAKPLMLTPELISQATDASLLIKRIEEMKSQLPEGDMLMATVGPSEQEPLVVTIRNIPVPRAAVVAELDRRQQEQRDILAGLGVMIVSDEELQVAKAQEAQAQAAADAHATVDLSVATEAPVAPAPQV